MENGDEGERSSRALWGRKERRGDIRGGDISKSNAFNIE